MIESCESCENLLNPVYCLGLVTRDPWALSTLYRTHRRHGAFLVRRNGGDVFLLYLRQ